MSMVKPQYKRCTVKRVNTSRTEVKRCALTISSGNLPNPAPQKQTQWEQNLQKTCIFKKTLFKKKNVCYFPAGIVPDFILQ